MRPIRILSLFSILIAVAFASVGQNTTNRAIAANAVLARVVDLKASDGIDLKVSYFAAAKPGPGVLLLQSVRLTTRAGPSKPISEKSSNETPSFQIAALGQSVVENRVINDLEL